MDKQSMKQTNIAVDADLKKEAQIKALRNGQTLQQILQGSIEARLREYLTEPLCGQKAQESA